MKAAYMLDKQIHVGALDDPTPGPGEVLVRTCSCGVCASDLHLLHSGKLISEWSREFDGPFKMDLTKPIVLGHEYVGEIIDYGVGAQRTLKKGTLVTSTPVRLLSDGVVGVGLANEAPGGFGEYMVLPEALLQPIPDTLGVDIGAMAEPVSVGVYYVKAARVTADDTPLVIGCGAIGLAMILALKLTSARPIIAADYNAHRRDLALAMGADIVIATQQVLARVPLATAEEVDAAVASARAAFVTWRKTPIGARARIFLKYQQLIRENMKQLAAILTAEQGKTLADAEGDVFRGLEVVEHAASIGNLQLGELANNVANGGRHLHAAATPGGMRRHHAVQLSRDDPAVDVPDGDRLRQHPSC